MSGDVERCPVPVWDSSGWHSSSCGRPVKRRGMCGIHARAKETREANDRMYREGEQRRKAMADDARSRLGSHGVHYRPTFTATQVADILDAALTPEADR